MKPLSKQNTAELELTLERLNHGLTPLEGGWKLNGKKSRALEPQPYRMALLEAIRYVSPAASRAGAKPGDTRAAGRKNTNQGKRWAAREYASVRPRVDLKHLPALEQRAESENVSLEEMLNRILDGVFPLHNHT